MLHLRAAFSAALCLYLLSAVSSTGHHRCPPGPDWHYRSGFCYSLSESTDGWFGAEKSCQKSGSYLGTIGDAAENNYLQALGQCYQSFWIGLVKTDVRNRKFAWWNDEPLNYTDPLSIRADSYFDCAYFSAGQSGSWHNIPCQNLHQQLCKLPARAAAGSDEELDTRDESQSQGKCPEGWLSIEGKCYYVSSKKANYFNAQISCESMGATVATVKSHREQLQLTIALGCSSRTWIGLEKVRPCLSDSSRTFCWTWLDGTSDDTYSAWAPSHPSSANEIECVYTQGRWYTTNCYYENNYVCMKKAAS